MIDRGGMVELEQCRLAAWLLDDRRELLEVVA
jgi:hypothetical protein